MPRARRVQAERVQPTCPSAGSIGGANLENQDQAVSVLEWRSSGRRSASAAAEQRIEHEAGPRHARRLSKLRISKMESRGRASSTGEWRTVVVVVYAVYAISSLDTDPSLRHGTQNCVGLRLGFVGTQQGVAGLTPRPFTLEEETGSHNGHGHVHRCLCCLQ